MLKNIPKILSPELLKVLCEMGHSDRIVIADANFPAESMGKDAIVIRADGHSATDLRDAILTVFPLDTYVENPVSLMQVMAGDNVETPIWDEYKAIVKSMTIEVQMHLVKSSVLHSMKRLKSAMQLLPQAKVHFMLILFFKKVL